MDPTNTNTNGMGQYMTIGKIILWMAPVLVSIGVMWGSLQAQVVRSQELAQIGIAANHDRIMGVELDQREVIKELKGIREEVIKLRTSMDVKVGKP